MQIVLNDLETRRFGVRFGRLSVTDGLYRLPEALAMADADGIKVVSARVDATDLGQVRALEDAGFRIMDTLVYHRRDLPLKDATTARPTNRAIFDLGPTDAAAGATLARRAFRGYLGHYHADPHLAHDAADAAYADWADRLLRDPSGGKIALGARDGAELTGFLVGQARGEAGSEIVLNAVDPDAQRGGIYTALLHAYLCRVGERGDREVVISTQLPNYAVQKAWSRTGFVLYQSFHTLHRWHPPQG